MTSRGLRLTAFLAILAFLALGPFYRHVLHGTHPALRNWVMYRGVGYGLVDARFLRRARDGGAHPIDRFTALGYAGPADAPEEVWRIVGRAGLEALAWCLCARLGPGTDLRAHAREATARGWVVLAAGERNLCGEAGSVSASGAEP
jgi:hypothetical protein